MFGVIHSRRFAGRGQPPPASGDAREISQEISQEADPQVGRIRKVLVVDDEADVADIAEILLEAHGLDAMVAYSGADALALLAANPDIDAVISDVMMPGMNGLQLAEQIDQRYPKVKIVLASGYMAPNLANGQPLNRLFIAKPYRIEQLIKLLYT